MFDVAHNLVLGDVIERDALWIAREIKLLTHRPHILVEVVGAVFIHDGVGLGEEQLNLVAVFLLPHVRL